jgi:hypothetical protein
VAIIGILVRIIIIIMQSTSVSTLLSPRSRSRNSYCSSRNPKRLRHLAQAGDGVAHLRPAGIPFPDLAAGDIAAAQNQSTGSL